MTAAACSPTRSRKRWCSALKASVQRGHRQRADALVVERQRRDQRGAQARLARHFADDEIQAGLAVEQRLALAHRPPDVAGAEREHQLAQHRRVDAAGFGTADRAGPLDLEEERAGRVRHQRAEARGDQREGVGDAEAAADRLRDP